MRVSDETHARLVALAAATGRRMQTVVDDAVAAYETNEFWRSFADGYNRLADDPTEWAAVSAERGAEASALHDGLDPES